MNVCLATSHFKYLFQEVYPGLEVVTEQNNFLHWADLMIFTGGADINPKMYDGTMNGSWGADPYRDRIEREIFNSCVLTGIPMLGVCRGHQILNVLEGGVLTPDILPSHSSFHDVVWLKDTPVMEVFQKGVNSLHHQGYTLDQMADNIIPYAIEPTTGIVEMAMSRDKLIMSVQFHPEMMKELTASFFQVVEDWVKEAK